MPQHGVRQPRRLTINSDVLEPTPPLNVIVELCRLRHGRVAAVEQDSDRRDQAREERMWGEANLVPRAGSI